MAWGCPECGHGSPEPRDRQAHLDAHRQLRQFIDAWDAAAAADQAAERNRRRRPLYALVVVLVVMILAGVSLGSFGGQGRDTYVPRGPIPAVQLPDAGPPAARARPAAAAPGRAPQAPPRGAPVPQPAASEPAPAAGVEGAAAPAAGEQAPSMATPPASTSVETAAPSSRAPAEPLLSVRGCVLVVCLNLGR